MDTRKKIIGFEDAVAIARTKPVRWVTGHFDPLLVEHARRLRELVAPGQTLVVVVANPENPLLPQSARAELVAALAGVDYVVLKTGPDTSAEPEDAAVTSNFIHHILERQRA